MPRSAAQTRQYSGKGSPQYIEGAIFKVVIPLGEKDIDGAIEELVIHSSGKMKANLKILLQWVRKEEGRRSPEYQKWLGVSERSVERYFQLLRKAELVEFRGNSAQTGGYYLTAKMKARMK